MTKNFAQLIQKKKNVMTLFIWLNLFILNAKMEKYIFESMKKLHSFYLFLQ